MIYLTNRDGGLTDEEGHYKYLAAAFTGNVISGMSVEQNSPLGMSVVVSGGDARVPYGSYAYNVWIPSGSPETATIPTADGSNPRIDRIVLYVDRSEGTQQVTPNNPGIAKIAVVAGTPGAIPVRPSDSDVNSAVSNNPWINLADVLVGTGVTQITNANITDTRLMVGPVIPNGFIGTNPLAPGAVTPDKLDTGAAYAYSNDAGTRANSSFGALTGGGTNPSITIDVPNTGMVFLSFGADAYSSTINELCEISVSTSGANSGVSIPAIAIRVGTNSGNPFTTGFTSQLLTGLTPGSTTFALVYRAFGTGNFQKRKLIVIPLG